MAKKTTKKGQTKSNRHATYILKGCITDQSDKSLRGLLVRGFDWGPHTLDNSLGNPAVTNADGNREIQLRNVIPKHYLSDHFQRLWTRLSFFATTESALISGRFLFQSSVPNRQLIFAGLIFPLSGAQYDAK